MSDHTFTRKGADGTAFTLSSINLMLFPISHGQLIRSRKTPLPRTLIARRKNNLTPFLHFVCMKMTTDVREQPFLSPTSFAICKRRASGLVRESSSVRQLGLTEWRTVTHPQEKKKKKKRERDRAKMQGHLNNHVRCRFPLFFRRGMISPSPFVLFVRVVTFLFT